MGTRVRLDHPIVNRLKTICIPGERYTDVIVRVAGADDDRSKTPCQVFSSGLMKARGASRYRSHNRWPIVTLSHCSRAPLALRPVCGARPPALSDLSQENSEPKGRGLVADKAAVLTVVAHT
jgi:hypothetical protein